MANIEVKCPFCGSAEVIKFGKRPNGSQRYRCKLCKKTFQLEYKYKACFPGVKDQIVDMAMNGSGTRDTARTLGVSKDTVTNSLKKLKDSVQPVNEAYLKKKSMNTSVDIEIHNALSLYDLPKALSAEMDEMKCGVIITIKNTKYGSGGL